MPAFISLCGLPRIEPQTVKMGQKLPIRTCKLLYRRRHPHLAKRKRAIYWDGFAYCVRQPMPAVRLQLAASKFNIELRRNFSRLKQVASDKQRRITMNWDQISGNWKQFEGKVQQQWGKLTSDDLQQVKGDQKMLAGKIQERYGITKDEAERQLNDWQSKL
jgi:uncharacterized protein YjbJ (UPF0337 family)